MAEPIMITGPAVEPVSLAEARRQLKIDDDNVSSDVDIEEMVAAARGQVELQCNRKLLPQTWDFVVDAFPEDCQSLKVPADLYPARRVVHIKYLDTSGAVQTVDPGTYDIDKANFIFLAAGSSWPSDAANSADAVSVRVECWTYEVPNDVDARFKRYIKAHITTQARFAGTLNPEQAYELANRFHERLLDGFINYTS